MSRGRHTASAYPDLSRTSDAPARSTFWRAADVIYLEFDSTESAVILVTGAPAPTPSLLGFVALLLDSVVDYSHRSAEAP